MGASVCPVCLAEHEEVVLIHRRLKVTLPPKSMTGWALCPEHQKLKDDGYVALVECSNRPTGVADANRTGSIAHVRESVWPKLFDIPVPDKGLCFVEVGTITKLQTRIEPT